MRAITHLVQLLLLLFLCVNLSAAQPAAPLTDVFLQGKTLIFVNRLTGEETLIETGGERFTLLADSVLYFDTTTRRMMIAEADGSTRQHRIIQMEADSRRIDWIVSPDKQVIAWTLTRASADGQLSTTTRLLTGTDDIREVFNDGPRSDGLRALPVAFSADFTKLYMDYQPDGVEALTAFPQYAGLFEVTLADGQQRFLPGEPGDFTGAGFGSDLFLRLELTNSLSGFNVHVFNLITGFDTVIPALDLRGYTQAGDMVIAPGGKYAVYALSQITGFGSSRQSVRTVFVLVDLVARTQTALTDPITQFVRPVAWTEDNSAVIFTSPQTDGTWKVNVESRGLPQKIAAVAYLGTINP